MSYRFEQNDNYIFFILYDEDFIFSLLKTEVLYTVFSEKIKIMKNFPVQANFTGKIFCN